MSRVKSVAIRSRFTLILKDDGTVWTCGYNAFGQLGTGNTTNADNPVQVAGLTGIVAVAAGKFHSVALKSDGTVWTWGYNNYGQLGDGTYAQKNLPVQVKVNATTLLTGVSLICGGDYSSLALKPDGTMWGWGYNDGGQLGNGNNTTAINYAAPSGVISNLIAISAGPSFGLGVKADGTVWGWGRNFTGQLGDGTTTTRYTPVQVGGTSNPLGNAAAVSAGGSHAFALLRDGTVKAWGNNLYGQFGNGSTTNSVTPVTVNQLNGATSVAAGSNHSVILKADGTRYACGFNAHGQLGNGTQTNSSIPTLCLRLDSDYDGMEDSLEITIGSNPADWDSNNDGLSDGSALRSGFSLTSSDTDGDGLTNTQELLLGTNVFYFDTDLDGIPDGQDFFPFDPALSGSPNPGDTIPPTIVLRKPAGLTIQ